MQLNLGIVIEFEFEILTFAAKLDINGIILLFKQL